MPASIRRTCFSARLNDGALSEAASYLKENLEIRVLLPFDDPSSPLFADDSKQASGFARGLLSLPSSPAGAQRGGS